MIRCRKALMLVGHGDRRGETRRVLHSLVDQFRMRDVRSGDYERFEIATLNDFSEILTGLLRDGVERVDVMPWFLVRGAHVEEDLPQMIRAAQEISGQKGAVVRLLEPLGDDPLLTQILIERLERLNASH